MSTTQPLPSLPPSPAPADDELETPTNRVDKGKQRQVEQHSDESSEDEDDTYPPGHDEYEETKRVEETLRRWEIAERQRRKSLRESVNGPQSPSVVGNVSRSASLLWSSRNKNLYPSRPSTGDHTALASSDSVDALPLADLPATPRTATSPAPANNPFNTPAESQDLSESPFADSQQSASLMSPSAEPPVASDAPSGLVPHRPVLVAKGSSYSKIPPPKPLDLPPPKAPPPVIQEPPASSPPPTIPHERGISSNDDDARQTKWWHEWLCGCGEGPDRGGEHQAGRTNPLE